MKGVATTRRINFGVATVYDGGTRFSCAVPLWCQSADALLAAVASNVTAPIVLGTTTPSEDCPHARYLWPNKTVSALLRYPAAKKSRGNLINLLKIHLFALLDLDVVLFTDLDVDMSPPKPPTETWKRWWHRSMDIFLRSPASVVASPDHEAPINTAVLLIKPSERIYDRALGVFLHQNLSFSAKTGFNKVGTPRELIDSAAVVDQRKLSLLASGFGLTRNRSSSNDEILRRLQRTRAYTRNAWSFAAGAIDQGIFFLLGLVLEPASVTWAQNGCRCSSRPWMITHYWGPYKPWRPVGAELLTGATVRYLRNLPNRTSSATQSTSCHLELSRLIARIQGKGMWNEKTAAVSSASRCPRAYREPAVRLDLRQSLCPLDSASPPSLAVYTHSLHTKSILAPSFTFASPLAWARERSPAGYPPFLAAHQLFGGRIDILFCTIVPPAQAHARTTDPRPTDSASGREAGPSAPTCRQSIGPARGLMRQSSVCDRTEERIEPNDAVLAVRRVDAVSAADDRFVRFRPIPIDSFMRHRTRFPPAISSVLAW